MLIKNRNKSTWTKGLRFAFITMLLAGFVNAAIAANDEKKITKSKVNTSFNKPNLKSLSQNTSVVQKHQLLVQFKQGVSVASKSNLHRSLGSKVKKSVKSVAGLQVIEVGPGKSVDKVLKQYQKDPSVIYAELDSKIKLKVIPNDTSFSELWGLNNTGQTGGVNDADINAPQAWDVTQGDSNVIVAVVDTGIDYEHLDLVDNMWTNPGEIPNNGIDDDSNGYIDDIHGIDTGDGDTDPMDTEGHGTHVAGTIGARGNNSLGVAGVNWNVTIIACKIFADTVGQDIEAFVSDAVECLDYLRDLKVNQGVDIVATNNSWGWIGNPSQTLLAAIQRQLDAGILFVAASGNDALDTDQFFDNPSSLYVPNIISVAASSHTDALAEFSNRGRRTVHVAAPGVDVLSSIAQSAAAGNSPPPQNPHDEIFIDDVESGSGTWTPEAPWGITAAMPFSGNNAWADSPAGNYSNNTDASLTGGTINLSSFAGQTVYLGFYANYEIETGFDNLHVEISTNSVTWTEVETITGISAGWEFFSIVIPQSHLVSTFRYRFRFETDFSITGDGVYIDDIGIGTGPFIPVSNSYMTASGTSMATPHVVGLAALIKAQDGSRTWDEIKNLIISSGTALPQFAGTTVSGRRIRAFDSNNTGALSCTDQTVLSRLQPTIDAFGVEAGDLVNISMLHINCGQPAGNVSVTIAETGDVVELLDNGLGFDQVAGDGIYSAQIDLGVLGEERINIQFPDATTVTANTVYNYLAGLNVTYQWRDISAVGQPLFSGNPDGYDDETVYRSTPFGIPFGNTTSPYNEIAIDTNGYVILRWTGEPPMEFSVYENFEIPLVGLSNIVAVFWDDLVVDAAAGTNVYWGVLGSAPNRELVITWQNVRAFGGSPGMTFQVVFSENSSDVIVNYQDTIIPDSFTDNGASATSGVQIAPNIGTQFSYNTPMLTSGSSVRWSMPAGVSNTPTTPPPAVRSSRGGGSFGLMLALLLPILLIARLARRQGSKLS